MYFYGEFFFDFLRGLIDGDGSISSQIGSFVIYGLNVVMFENISKKLEEFYPKIYTNIVKDGDSNCYEFRVSGGNKNSQDYMDYVSSKIW